jgi:hypothetical protein
MAKTQLVINVKIDGLRETLRAFRDLPKEASDEARDEAGKIAQDMAAWISASLAENRQASLLIPTVKVARDRVPAVTVGGASRVGSRRTQAYKVLFGANFGARSFPQFRPWAGKGQDYHIFSQIEAHQDEVEERYLTAMDRVIDKWSNSEGV